MQKNKYIFWLVIISLTVYINTFLMDFVWDDFQQIVYNSLLDDVRFSFFRLFKENLNNNMPIYFRPLFTYSLALDTLMWGKQNPAGFHLTNILLNATVVFLAYFTLLKLEVPVVSAFVATAIFAVHPVHNEVVALISARNELLSAIFMLSSFLVYTLYRTKNGVWQSFSALLYFFAMLSKENAIFFPVLLILYDKLYSNITLKDALRRSTPFILSLVFYLLLRYIILPIPFGFNDPLKERLVNFVIAIVHYIKSVFYPINLKVLYDIRPTYSYLILNVISFVLLLTLSFLLIIFKRDRRITFLLFFSLVILLPASNLFSLLRPATVADRYNYLPSLGIIAIFVLLTEKLFMKTEGEMIFTGKVFYTVIIFFLGISTLQRNWKWENYTIFAQEMVENAPMSPFAYNNLGISYTLANKHVEAEAAFKKTLELQPNHDGALYGLGRVYLEQGRFEEAVKCFKPVVISKPLFVDAHYYLGEAYRTLGLFHNAENAFLNAVKVNPEYYLAYGALGETYLIQGRYSDALKAFQSAVKLAPWQKEYETKLRETLKLMQN